MVNINTVSEHFYAIIPNGNGYKVDWATKVNNTLYRAPACNDANRTVVFGIQDPLDIAISKVKQLQKLQQTDYDIVVYRRSKYDPYTFETDYKVA